jgi:D-threo-aldose 1-dehydrogenase
MERRTLGLTKVEVTRLGFGGAPIGNLFQAVSEADGADAVAAALEAGVGWFDTAPHYGAGLSEQRLGAALVGQNATVSTKVGRVLRRVPEGEPLPDWGFVDTPRMTPVFDYSRAGVLRAFESSLERLGREHVELLLLHDIGRLTHGSGHADVLRQALDEALPAMLELKAQGRIDAVGIGVNEVEVCDAVLDHADLDAIMLAGRYTLLEQDALPLLDRCAARDVSVLVAGPFNSGVLVRRGAEATYNYAPPPDAVRTRVERLASVCAQFDTPLPAAALQFPLAHSAVASVVPGARSRAEMVAIAAWHAMPVPVELWAALRGEGLLAEGAPTPA